MKRRKPDTEWLSLRTCAERLECDVVTAMSLLERHRVRIQTEGDQTLYEGAAVDQLAALRRGTRGGGTR